MNYYLKKEENLLMTIDENSVKYKKLENEHILLQDKLKE
jgi:hypothetical protein